MRPNQSSLTAENNAILRANEFLRPPEERICHDPYALYFLPESIFSADDRNDQIQAAVSRWETHFPGVCNAILARTRFIDDCLEQAISEGIRQLVILGAGYDTRALRFDALRQGVMVFEADHPATQRLKTERIDKYFDVDLANVHFVPVDLSGEKLEEKLLVPPYDEKKKTLFIWEGVTYYLPAPAVDRTLLSIRDCSASGSSIIFDYFPPSVADGTTLLREAKALREGLKHIGEKIVFGITPSKITDFMRDRGFAVTKNLSGKDLKKAYFKDANKNRLLSGMFMFVQAKVQ